MVIKNFILKLKNPHSINLVGNAVMSLLNMVQVAVLFNYLSINGMGIWFFFQATIGLADTFRSGLISTAFVTSYSGATELRAREVAGSAWFLSLIITSIFIVINASYLVLPFELPDKGLDLFFTWMGLVFVINLPSFLAACVAQAEQRFDRLLYIRAFSTTVSIILVLTLILLDKIDLMNVVYSGFIAGGLTSLMTVLLGWSRINTIVYKSKKATKAIFDFGKYSVGTALGSSMFRTSDTYIINFMLGPGSLAVYNLALRLMELIEIPMRSFAATAMPPLSAAYNQNNRPYVIHLLKKYAGMVTIVLIPVVIGAVLFADVAVWIIDKKYLETEAANILRVLMTFALLMPVERFMAFTLDAINKPKINMMKLVVMLTVNILGDFAGILIFGNIYGLAISGILPVLTGLFISYYYIRQYHEFKMVDVYKTGYTELKHLASDYLSFFKKKR